MSKLKGSKTEANLKEAFAGESQANRRYLYFANKADVKARTMSRHCSVRPLKAKPATPTATSSTSSSAAIRQPACRSVLRVRT